MAASTHNVVMLNHLPPEVLEEIGLYLPVRSISALKCVNKYFNDVFSGDIFWKKYLYYPESHFKSDLQSNSPAPEVAEVVADITSGAVGRWRGYYNLQRARLQTAGSDQYDAIPLPPGCSTRDITDLQEMIDDHSERWLFVVTKHDTSVANTLHIWNITSTPRPLQTVCMRWKSRIIKLLPEGKVLLMEYLIHNTQRIHCICVYLFKHPTYNLEMQFKFTYDMEITPERMLEDVGRTGFVFVGIGDVFVTCKSDWNVTDLNESALHVWNIRSSTKLAKVCLNQSGTIQQFQNYLKTNMFDRGSSYEMDLFPGSSIPPFSIIVAMRESNVHNVSQLNIFDLSTLQFTAIVLQTTTSVSDCHMFADKLCVQSESHEYEDAGFGHGHCVVYPSILIYSLETKPKLLKTIESVYIRPDSDHEQQDPTEINEKIIFHGSKIFVQNGANVDIWSLDTDPLQVQQVILYGGYILSYIEPQLLLVYDRFVLPDSGMWAGRIKVIKTSDGSELCEWRNACHGNALKNYYSQVQYPTKLLFCVGNELHLYVR